ncbi:MAG: 50S ribosomal protein L13 [bacterium]|nr:50S ribosomal protein L13 [bacterium]
MPHTTTSTRSIKAQEVSHSWHLVDMEGKTLGRETTHVSTLLQGKEKRNYAPYIDNGDHVVVINASKVSVTGKKLADKEYDTYSGYPGGRRTVSLGQALLRDSRKVIRYAVSGMLPKNKLRDVRLSRLHIYEGSEHPHTEVTSK